MTIDLEAYLKKGLEELKADKLKIDIAIPSIESLLKKLSNRDQEGNHDTNSDLCIINNVKRDLNKETLRNISRNIVRNTSKRIFKGAEIYNVCEAMCHEFSSTDIKRLLEESQNKEISNISIAHISYLLGKLAKDKKIKFVRQGIGKGNPRYYIFNRENNIEQIEREQKESPRIFA